MTEDLRFDFINKQKQSLALVYKFSKISGNERGQ